MANLLALKTIFRDRFYSGKDPLERGQRAHEVIELHRIAIRERAFEERGNFFFVPLVYDFTYLCVRFLRQPCNERAEGELRDKSVLTTTSARK